MRKKLGGKKMSHLSELLIAVHIEQVLVWKDDKFQHQYETCEEVWDMDLTDDHLYSVRDRDLVVQKIHKTDHGHKLNTVKVLEGRGPMCRVDGKIAILSRNGMDVHILDDDRAQFKRIGIIKVRNARHLSPSCSLRPIGKKLQKEEKKTRPW